MKSFKFTTHVDLNVIHNRRVQFTLSYSLCLQVYHADIHALSKSVCCVCWRRRALIGDHWVQPLLNLWRMFTYIRIVSTHLLKDYQGGDSVTGSGRVVTTIVSTLPLGRDMKVITSFFQKESNERPTYNTRWHSRNEMSRSYRCACCRQMTCHDTRVLVGSYDNDGEE